MAVNVDILKDRLSNYNDSLNDHLGQLQTDFGLLQNSYQLFARAYEGRDAEEVKIKWELTMSWFEDYLTSTLNLSIVLDERLNSLNNMALAGNGTTWVKGASLRPEKKSILKNDINNIINDKLEPNHTYKVDSYTYVTDEFGRIVNVSGSLTLKPRGRNPEIQKKAKEDKNGLPSDQGGHLIAQTFYGPTETINILPMSKTLNKSEWYRLENAWKKSLKEHIKVTIMIIPVYKTKNQRPDRFKVFYELGDMQFVKTFMN